MESAPVPELQCFRVWFSFSSCWYLPWWLICINSQSALRILAILHRIWNKQVTNHPATMTPGMSHFEFCSVYLGSHWSLHSAMTPLAEGTSCFYLALSSIKSSFWHSHLLAKILISSQSSESHGCVCMSMCTGTETTRRCFGSKFFDPLIFFQL